MLVVVVGLIFILLHWDNQDNNEEFIKEFPCKVESTQATISTLWDSDNYNYRLWYRTSPYSDYKCLLFNIQTVGILGFNSSLYHIEENQPLVWNLVGSCKLVINNGECSLISDNNNIKSFRTSDYYIEEK